MQACSLRIRAIVFALGTGAVSFVLALGAASYVGAAGDASRALIPAVVCAAMCWASAEAAVSSTAAAIDLAIDRLAAAAQGDLDSPIPGEVGHRVPLLAAAMARVFGQLGANLEKVQRLATIDPVTGLANRAQFCACAERALEAMAPEAGAALLFIDLDRFKSVNDSLGHSVGDRLLRLVADRLRAVADDVAGTRPRPLIGRLSGDEFTLFAEIDNPADGALIGRAIGAALARPFALGSHEVSIGASIGVALLPPSGARLGALVDAADAAMYRAKSIGRGCVVVHDEALAATLAAQVEFESALRSALADDRVSIHFAPQLESGSDAVAAVHAVPFWHDPAGVAHRVEGSEAAGGGLGAELGRWVARAAAAEVARWLRSGRELRVAIALMPRQIDAPRFLELVREAFSAVGAPLHLLELEIEESGELHERAMLRAAITALRDDGATITLVRFGESSSTLGRLHDLPIDRIKLGSTLIEHVADRADARAVAQAMIALIHGLGYRTVAEGVDGAAQAEVLRVIGCDALQGDAIVPAMDTDGIDAWFNARRRHRRVG